MTNSALCTPHRRIKCQTCALRHLCLLGHLPGDDIDSLEQHIQHSQLIQRGKYLFFSGEPAHSLYAVHSGSVKTYLVDNAGNEQVIGFHLTGELIGLDGLDEGHHLVSARTLETSSICEIPITELMNPGGKLHGLSSRLLRIASHQLREDEEHLFWIGKYNPEQRLALFLLNLSERYQQRGFSATEFNLSMSRIDIANYLAVAGETISRMLLLLQQKGLIRVDRKLVRLDNLNGLKELVSS
ncbi:MAG: helix-turn-helix domain-containing protein [Gammaproteobacteria bacterium]|nr:helix-turn-helix domain-containing protein [Gammaproteobacteria bacterium]